MTLTLLPAPTVAEVGLLQARGASQAQYGMRVNDDGGNPIADSLGLIGVMSQLGSLHIGAQAAITSTTYVAVGNTQINFTLSRQVRVLGVYTTQNNVTGTGNYGYGTFGVDGVAQPSASTFAIYVVGGQIVNSTLLWSASLAAGSHNITLMARGDPGNTVNTWSVDGWLFQLGA